MTRKLVVLFIFGLWPAVGMGQQASIVKPVQSPSPQTQARAVWSSSVALADPTREARQNEGDSPGQIIWQSSATKRGLVRGSRGTLEVLSAGVDFSIGNTPKYRWDYVEIKSFNVSPRELTVETYQNKILHQPGTKKYRFRVEQPIPPSVAAELARRAGKPVRNADPDSNSPSFASIPAHHHLNFGGTNGILHFRDGGIDYVTRSGDARSWQWTDIETVSSPDAYHLLVFGYLDSYRFDLKQPMTRDLLNRLTDATFAHHSLNRSGNSGESDE